MTIERTEVEILSRSGIPIVMGETTYLVRPLTMDGTDLWETRIRTVLSEMFALLGRAGGGVEAILGLYRSSIDAELDALYAYDELGGKPVLPDRATLRATASRDDVDVALRRLVKHEFPLLKGMDFVGTWVPTELREMVTRELMLLLPEPSAPAPSLNVSPTSIPPTPRKRSKRR